MDVSLKLSALYYIFLNLLIYTHAQDIFGAILGGVQDGINLVNNNLGVGNRNYPDYEQPASRDVSFSRSNEVSQSNQKESEEPYNSNSEQRQGDDSNWNSEEYDRGNIHYIENKKKNPIRNQIINNKKQHRSPIRNIGPLKRINKNKTNIRKPALLDNQKPLPLEKEKLESNISVTENKDNFNPLNVTKIMNNGSRRTSALLVRANNTAVNKKIPNLSVTDSSLNQNTLNSTPPVTNKNILKVDDKYVLKALTKKKFFFQAKPVVPLSEEVSANETIYYIDFD